MQEAMLWHKERNGVRCDLCPWNCFISRDKVGICLVRKNVNNKLFSLNFGKIAAWNVDPVEKDPLFHFYPGSSTLTINVSGNNFRCSFCSNYDAKHGVDFKVIGEERSPEDIIKLAEKNNCKSISFSYSEPTMYFEFVFRAAKLARRSNIKNIFITNGYMSEEGVKKIAKFIDASVINFKASGDPEFYKKFISVESLDPVYESIKQMEKQRVHLEISNLIIPQVGDNLEYCRKLAEWISTEIGSEVPFHVLQFKPTFKTAELPPTSIATLEKFIDTARSAGLRYVYIGIEEEHDAENTYCHNCREPLIFRKGRSIKKINLLRDRCPNCGLKTNVITE